MDLIAAKAETTKPTVYAHFGSKESLFEAVAVSVADMVQSPQYSPFDPGKKVDEQLYRLLKIYVDSILNSENLNVMRAVILEYSSRRTAYSFEMRTLKKSVIDEWLKAAKAHRVVNITDTEAASLNIVNLVEGTLIWPALLQMGEQSEAERIAQLRSVTEFSARAISA